MKDPLRDNRIFPEEMHQRSVTPTRSKSNYSWLWFLIATLIIVLLAWLGYQTYLQNQTKEPTDTTFKQQQEAFDAVHRPIDPEVRDQTIERFLESR